MSVEWPRLLDEVIVLECESDAWFQRPEGVSDEQMTEIRETIESLMAPYADRMAENVRRLMEIVPPSRPDRGVLADSRGSA